MTSGLKVRHYLIAIVLASVLLILWNLLPGKAINFENIQKSGKIDHDQWDEILNRFIDENGHVDYNGLLSERNKLTSYLQLLSENPPDPFSWTINERIAYWINAYNAFTLDLILEHYPIERIKDIGSSIQIPFINSPWDIKFIRIGNRELDLNNIEHGILRKEFDEPRIHFAIVCASMSCPGLRREAYTSSKLDSQLNQQAEIFINDLFKNEIEPEKLKISKIFKWFNGDFTQEGTLIEYLNKFSNVQIQGNAKIEFKPYDWNLNQSPPDP